MKRLFSYILIIIILTGTVGLNYDAHYCGGNLITSSLSLVPRNLSCGMANMDDQSEDDQSLSFKKQCCENDHFTFQIEDDFNDFDSYVDVFAYDLIVPPSLTSLFVFNQAELRYEFIGYSPPPLRQNIIITNQTFLI